MSPVISHAEEGWELAKQLGAKLEAAEAKLAAGPWDAWRDAEAEVERLREALDFAEGWIERDRADAAEAEVERLRSRVSSLETQWAESDTAAAIFQAMSRAEAAEAEVARLRAALGECYSDLCKLEPLLTDTEQARLLLSAISWCKHLKAAGME